MCVVLPVDHTPCSHTVAIWQYCIHAFRSFSGLKPCSRVRQHPRPILTRKMCIHCGGPRYFARRGGIAERGRGSRASVQKKESDSPYDSGYCSDVIQEEEGYETDSTLSPRAAKMPKMKWPTFSRQSSSSARRSDSRNSSWRPNLKKELTRRESTDSMMTGYSEKSNNVFFSQSPKEITPPKRSMSPILRRPSPERKNSTLLHPSSPVDMTADDTYTRSFSMGDVTPPAALPERQDSTLLRPSSPDAEMPMKDILNAKSFTSILSLPPPITAEPSPICTSVPLLRPVLPPRQPSTLLHPSSPNDSSPPNIEILSISAQPTEETRTSYPFPVLTQTPPTPLPNEVIFQRRASVLHSALSDDEWEEPLHSSQSDNDYESDDDGYEEKGADADTESFDDQVAKEAAVVVKTGRMARASRISFHGQSLRILV